MKKSDLRVLEVAASWAARLNWLETLRSASVAMRDATEEQAAAEYDRGLFILVKDMAEGLPMLRDALADTEEEGDWRAVGEYAEEFRRLAERLETLAAERFGRVIDGAAQEGDEFTAQTAAAVAGEVRLLLEMHGKGKAKAGAMPRRKREVREFVRCDKSGRVCDVMKRKGTTAEMQKALSVAAVHLGLLSEDVSAAALHRLFSESGTAGAASAKAIGRAIDAYIRRRGDTEKLAMPRCGGVPDHVMREAWDALAQFDCGGAFSGGKRE